ncbi:MAG TPA: DNA primase [Ferruginibacter sp.]|nr:DNA primase [Ferruginibacter sp.]
MISQQSIQEIQSRIDIIDVVGSFVKLKKRGTNYLGLCPFHNEKTPSFTVSPGKEIYKCFGCGKSGNTIGFVMEHEKYSYVEALRWLANRYNVVLEETDSSPEYKAQQQTADSLYIINQFAQGFFSEQLFDTDEGQTIALSYLRERGFRDDIIRKFQLGYNPSARDSFTQTALAKQYNPELLVKSGLVANREGSMYDNYRGRIIFPIHNQSGKVMGFGARVIKSNDKAPKYINTPENEIYVKSRILYGSYFARTAIDKADECLLVEGYTDVISLHQAGIENVVASGGTSLTTDQLRLIKKYSNNLTIIYDGDSAGVKAALRGLDLALDEGLNVRLVLIPDGEDPDSYVRLVGAQAFNEFIQKEKKDFILFQLQVSLQEAGNDSVKKSQVVNQVAESISRINRAEDFTRRQDYIKQVSGMLKVEEAGFTNLVNTIIRDRISREENRQRQKQEPEPATDSVEQSTPESQAGTQLLNAYEKHEQAIIRCLIEYGLKPWNDQMTVAQYIFQELEEAPDDYSENIANPVHLKILQLYKIWYHDGLEPNYQSFSYSEDPEISQAVVNLAVIDQDISPNWKKHYEGYIPTREDLYRDEVRSTIAYLKLRNIHRQMEENQSEMEKSTDIDQQMISLKVHALLKQKELEILEMIKVGTVIFK